tara:strand:+ start:2559 stop:3056 length:498 start_codon:yes stop_codon:yes gene_type:complete
MKKVYFLLIALFFLNGCAESIAFLGSSVGGASSGKMLQSSLNSAISYGVKHKTGKTPLGHMLTYAEEKNPEKKKETCFSFIENTRSEFCTIAKKQISSTKTAFKERTLEIVKIYPKTKNVILEKENDLLSSFFQSKKSPRKLAIVFQNKMKKNGDSWPQSNKSRP